MAKVLVILRHENSLNVVRDFLAERQHTPLLVALDPVDLPVEVPTALAAIKDSFNQGLTAIVLGTKVYDDAKSEKTDPPKRLIQFLKQLKDWGAGSLPVVLTHLSDMPDDLADQMKAIGLSISYAENDNLKRDGMSNLGPLIVAALKL